MKVACTCGKLIHDTTDALPHKAHLIPDREWFPFWDAVDAAAETAPATEATVMGLRRARMTRFGWECTDCGRLWVDGNDGEVYACSPDNGKPNGVLA